MLPVHSSCLALTRIPSKSCFAALPFTWHARMHEADLKPPAHAAAARTALRFNGPSPPPKVQAGPVFLTFPRGRQQAQRPLFSVKAVVFANGVLDRLTVDTGLVQVTADLQALKMGTVPVCPRS